MTSRSEIKHGAQGGFTLFETLITLAILASLLALGVSAIRGPSDSLRLQQVASDLLDEAALARHDAIKNRRSVHWDVSSASCDQNLDTVTFFSDGSARGPDLCLSVKTSFLRLTLLPLLGQYRQSEDP